MQYLIFTCKMPLPAKLSDEDIEQLGAMLVQQFQATGMEVQVRRAEE